MPHALERLRVDDRVHGNRDPFGRRSLLAGLRVDDVVEVLAAVDRRRQHLVNLLDTPGAPPHQLAAFVQVLGNLLDAHPSASVAVQVQLEDAPDDRGLGLVNLQLALASPAIAERFRRDGLVSERRTRAVEKPSAGVLPHRSRGVLGVLLALVFVERREDAPRQLTRGILGGLLCDRDDFDAVLGEPAFIDAKRDDIAEEPRQAVNDERVVRRRREGRIRDHLLKHGPAIVGGRRPWLDVLLGDEQSL
ncbi:MAG: hypothetical protein WBO04_15165 [Steroidobacteraceae bacterium]